MGIKWNSYIPSVNPSLGACYIAAPLWQDVIDWFREKHYLDAYVSNYYNQRFYPVVEEVRHPKTIDSDELRIVNEYDNFYDAREKTILKSIELCQNKK